MRFFAFLLLLLAPAAVAVGAVRPSAAERNSSARLLACDAEARTASFQGSMKAFGRAVELSMRFTLQVRDVANPDWRRVEAPTFDTWLTAAEGKSRYVYDKSVENLPVGADYRSIARFRWRSAKGTVVGRAADRTRACRQPDTRANLVPIRIGISAGSKEDTRFYSVRVANVGESDAPLFSIGVDVPGAVIGEQSTGEPLAPGEEDVFDFEGPRCAEGTMVTATVDTGASVDESDEMDNVLALACPTARGSS